MRTALGRVLGLGSAKSGTEDFLKDKIRAVALPLLTPYVIGIGLFVFRKPHDEVIRILAFPWIIIPLTLFVLISIFHMRLGMQTIIEDYVHHAPSKAVLMLMNLTFCLLIGSLSIYAMVRILIIAA
ncbi:succinate dehydrogenase, hydrophobic membrane anchor protein [Pseudomonas sp. R2.Fl]|nr:succinate dehydrogenase, hydrophobic membrane anchor protein [Pseudomonas sp. R2.Fl]